LKDYYLLELLLFVKIFWILIVVKDREKMIGDIDLYVSFQIRFRRRQFGSVEYSEGRC